MRTASNTVSATNKENEMLFTNCDACHNAVNESELINRKFIVEGQPMNIKVCRECLMKPYSQSTLLREG
jgi:hypothetical protein